MVCEDIPRPSLPVLIPNSCSGRCPWFQKFRTALGRTKSLEEIEALVRVKVERWRDNPPRGLDVDIHGDDNGADFLTITSEDLDESIDLGLILR